MPPHITKSALHAIAIKDSTLVIDNGAYTIKAGIVSDSLNSDPHCHTIPNCLAKKPQSKHVWVGSQLEQCTDFAEMSFRRPLQKGYLVNWEVEREIWDHSFFDKGAKVPCDPHETNLLLTEAPNAPSSLQTNCDQMIFEEFEFAAYRRSLGPSLNCYNDIASLMGDTQRTRLGAVPAECLLVVDSGYSHTTVTPLYQGRAVQNAVRRLEIGGKFLTNYLKELLSVRQMDVREETAMVNLMKEDACFVSRNFRDDLEKTWKHSPKGGTDGGGIIVDYVMPDYTSRMRGEQRPYNPASRKIMSKTGFITTATGVQEYVVSLGNERFIVPELIFTPGDIGMKQAGLPELIMQSMSRVPPGLWTAMLSNVLVVGGNAMIPGFTERLFDDLRQLAPVECVVRVQRASDPIKSTWLGGALLASNKGALQEVMVTREQYQEYGSSWLLKHFAVRKGG